MIQILRHANVSTTMNIYLKTVSADAANAMRNLETMCATTVQPERLGSARIMQKFCFARSLQISTLNAVREKLAERGGLKPPLVRGR